MRCVKLQEYSSNGCGDTAVNVLRSPNKVSLITDQLQPSLKQFVVHAWKVPGISFQVNP